METGNSQLSNTSKIVKVHRCNFGEKSSNFVDRHLNSNFAFSTTRTPTLGHVYKHTITQ